MLILNDEALEKAGDKEDFKMLLEKVVDEFLRFDPSPNECAAIALSADTETTQLAAAECCVMPWDFKYPRDKKN